MSIIGIILITTVTYFIVLFFLTATVGHQEFEEWTVQGFSNHYYVENYNIKNVRLVKKEHKKIKRISKNYPLEVSRIWLWGDDREFLVVKELKNETIGDMNEKELKLFLQDNRYNDDLLAYIIVETLNDKVYGPYNVKEYNHIISSNNIRLFDCRSTYGGGGFC